MKKLCVLLPGIGYHCDKPLLYYTSRLAMQKGYDIVRVDYSHAVFPEKIRGDIQKTSKAIELVIAETYRCLDAIDIKSYARVLFAAKSIGTVGAARYAAASDIDADVILFTPLEQTFVQPPKHAVCFHGTADPWAETPVISRLCSEADIPLYITPGANHSLETGDPINDIDTLAKTINICDDFIA